MATRLRALLAGAALLMPLAAGAAPIVVTYEITGGEGFGDFEGGFIQSGTIVVTFPNPGSGPPPLTTTGHSIYIDILTGHENGTRLFPFKRTFKATRLPMGQAYRGAHKTLRAVRSGSDVILCTPTLGMCEGTISFVMNADANGQLFAHYFHQSTNTATPFGFIRITGQEVASTREPASGSLLALFGVGIGGVVGAARRLGRRRT